jgi:rare lipoprotein A
MRYGALRLAPFLCLLPALAWVCLTANADDTEHGIASWYGYPYDGRRAAGGEIYDMEKLTAAHRTLPFGTWVRVVNLSNGETVDVRITDRGPFVDGRVIDLSRAAARAISLIAPGITPVRLEVIASGTAPAAGEPISPPGMMNDIVFAVQVGAFEDRGNARRCLARMRSHYGPAHLVRQGEQGMWRVLMGYGNSRDEAGTLARQFRQNPGVGAFVVRLDPSWVEHDGEPLRQSKRDSSAE